MVEPFISSLKYADIRYHRDASRNLRRVFARAIETIDVIRLPVISVDLGGGECLHVLANQIKIPLFFWWRLAHPYPKEITGFSELAVLSAQYSVVTARDPMSMIYALACRQPC